MILLQTLLDQLKMKDALVFRSASVNEVQTTSISLVKAGFGRIPRGYLNFLNLSDGLSWNGVELFSCTPHERAGTVFNQPDLLEYQTKYAKGHFFNRRLVLGRTMEMLLCYSADTHCYEFVDRNSLSVVLKLPRFEDVLYRIMA